MSDEVITALDENDVRWCGVHECTRGSRATYFVAWKTKGGASGAYRCTHHAREFARRRKVAFPCKP